MVRGKQSNVNATTVNESAVVSIAPLPCRLLLTAFTAVHSISHRVNLRSGDSPTACVFENRTLEQ
jgi:hypothetical protein